MARITRKLLNNHWLSFSRPLTRIAWSGLLLAFGVFLGWMDVTVNAALSLFLFALSYLIVGLPVVLRALQHVRKGLIFDEYTLMTIATLGAIALGEYPEAVAVMLFYSIGEYFQDVAIQDSRASVKSLLELRPETARIEDENGETVRPLHRIRPDDTIILHPGERVPLDVRVLTGASSVDNSALTGEATPQAVEPGDEILAGSINNEGMLRLHVLRDEEHSAVSRIVQLVEEASARKAKTERFITRFARYYTPVVVFGALALATLPPLLLTDAAWSDWIYRALILLVISCPCALVISVPMGYYAGIGRASQIGILIKGAEVIDRIPTVRSIIFDKTGTLTRGQIEISRVRPETGFTSQQVLRYAKGVAQYSSHPVAQAVRRYHQGEDEDKSSAPKIHQEIPGQGILSEVEGDRIVLGNSKLMERENIRLHHPMASRTYVAFNGQLIGQIELNDRLRCEALPVLQQLRDEGIQRMAILSGDSEQATRTIADALDISDFRFGLMPDEKVRALQDLRQNQRIMYVGEGINDAPIIAAADVGVALGGLGSDAALEASDLVIMDDDLNRLVAARRLAKKTRHVIIQNITLALGLKAVFLTLGALGLAGLWSAIFADVGVTLLAVSNSLRLFRFRS